jgi:hypothetical protein
MSSYILWRLDNKKLSKMKVVILAFIFLFLKGLSEKRRKIILLFEDNFFSFEETIVQTKAEKKIFNLNCQIFFGQTFQLLKGHSKKYI